MKKYKTTIKILLSLLLVFGIVFGVYEIVYAETNDSYVFQYKGQGEYGNSIVFNGNEYGTKLFQLNRTDVSETDNAYCCDLVTGIKQSVPFAREELETATYYSDSDARKLRSIIWNSYPHKSVADVSAASGIAGLNQQQVITATQLAIWNFANGSPAVTLKVADQKTLDLKAWLLSRDGMGKKVDQASVSVNTKLANFSGDKLTLTIEYYVSGKNVDGSSIVPDYSITNKSNWGSASVKENGKDSDGHYSVTISDLPTDAEFTFTASAMQSVSFDAWFYHPQGGRDASQSLIGPYEGKTPISNKIDYKGFAGSIKVKKVVSNQSSADPEFSFKITGGPENSIERTFTVKASDGFKTISGLPYGDYKISEINVPKGYDKVSVDPDSFTIDSSHRNSVEITATNKEDGKIVISKEFDTSVSDDTSFNFKLTDPDKKVTTFTLKAGDSKTFDNLKFGSYTIQEVTDGMDAQYGLKGLYQGDTKLDNPATVTIGPDAPELSVKAINQKKGYIKLIKVNDWNDKEKLPDAEFVIADNANFSTENGGIVFNAKTDANGEFKSDYFAPNTTWYIKETKAPEGFVLNKDVQTVKLNSGLNTVTFKDAPVNNCWLKIKKTDAFSGDPLNNAVFAIATDENFTKDYATYTIQKDGMITTQDLVPGTWYVKEVTPPDGYAKDDSVKSVVIKWHETGEVSFADKPIGSITVKKTLSAGLTDASTAFGFTLTGNGVNESFGIKAGEQKKIDNLPYGEYTLTENATTGYKLVGYTVNSDAQVTESSVKVTIGKTATAVKPNDATVTVENRRLGKIILKKTFAGDYTNATQAFKIRVTGPDSQTKDYDVISGKDTVIDNLEYGNYKVEEVSIPDGFVFSKMEINGQIATPPAAFTISASTVEVTVTTENRAWSKIQLIKVNSWDTTKRVPGAEYAISDNADFGTTSGTVISAKTDANGEFTTGELLAGKKYYIKETKAPADFELDTHVETVTLKEGVNTVTFKDAPINHCWIKLKKIDSVTKQPVNDVVFELASDENFTKDYATYTITANGTVTTADLVPGTWYVREKTAPAGYIKDNTVQKITVAWDETKELEFANTPVGSLTIEKLLDGGYTDTATNFSFTLTGNNVNESFTLKAGEKKTFNNLLYGDYTVTENKIADTSYSLLGYKVNDGSITAGDNIKVTVGQAAKAIKVSAVNRKLGKLVLKKAFTGSYKNTTQAFKLRVTGPDGQSKDYDVVSGTDTVISNLAYGAYKVEEVSIPTGFSLASLKVNDGIVASPATVNVGADATEVTVTAVNKPEGRIHVQKFDKVTGKTLQGMVFSLSNNADFSTANGGIVITGTTDANGEFYSDYLTAGDTWYAKETKVPDGYKLDTTVQTVTLATGDNLIVFRDVPIGGMRIVKVDAATGDKLSGAKFDIYTDSALKNKYSSISITSADGVELTDVPGGTYYFVETQAPEGYTVDTTPVKADVTANAITAVTLKDTKGSYIIWKKDSTTQKKLGGAKFDIYNASSALVGHFTTDADGKIPLTNFTAGTYKVVETAAPAGYDALKTPITLTIKEGQTGDIVILNDATVHDYKTGNLKLLKVDADSGKGLAGAHFDIYSDAALTKRVFYDLTTDKNGVILNEGMDAGTYWLKEAIAPTGYTKLTTSIKVTVAEGETTTFTVKNKKTSEENYQTGTNDYNLIIIGGALLLAGIIFILVSRKKKARHAR